jgi:hypothetical protein
MSGVGFGACYKSFLLLFFRPSIPPYTDDHVCIVNAKNWLDGTYSATNLPGKHQSSPKSSSCTSPPKASRMRNYSKTYDRKSMSCIAVLITQFNFPDFEAPT